MDTAKVFRKLSSAKLPARATGGSVGYDLYAAEDAEVSPGKVTLVRTGLVIRPPKGYFISIRSRSSLGTKHLVTIPQSVGTIDIDYVGPDDEIKVALIMLPAMNRDEHKICTINKFQEPLQIRAGDRIAQMLFEKVNCPELEELEEPPAPVSRGGFGSSGTR